MAGIFGGENYRTFKKEMDSIVSKTVHNQLMEIDPNYVHWVEKLAKAEHLEQKQLARREIKKIVDTQYEHAKTLLSENKDMLEFIAKKLLEKETLDEKEFEDLMNEVKQQRTFDKWD